MTDFEKELARALQRQQPAPDFTARVLDASRAQKKAEAGWKHWFRTSRARMFRLTPALAALILVGSGAIFERHHREQEGEKAKRQLLTALRITSEKLHLTEQRVLQAGK
jgi:hypothetical protein